MKPKWLGLAALVLMALPLLFPLTAYAQSCSLCYTQAASSGSRLIQALRNGILVLLVPPMLISTGLTLLCYSKRDRCRDRVEESPRSDLGW